MRKTRVFNNDYAKCPRCNWCKHCKQVSANGYVCTAYSGEYHGSKFSEYMSNQPKSTCSGFNPE